MQRMSEMLRNEDAGVETKEEVNKVESKSRPQKRNSSFVRRSIVQNFGGVDFQSCLAEMESKNLNNPPTRMSLLPLSSSTSSTFHDVDSSNSNIRATSTIEVIDTSWKASLIASQDRPDTDLRSGSRVRVMYKEGDDLRQDVVVLQFLQLMDKLWKDANLDLPMVIYRVQPTGFRKGVIELVPNSKTWQEILDNFGGDNQAPIRYLRRHNPTTKMYEHALERFTRSLAAYFVATGITGLGDRHQDNIMLASNGIFFHIDYGLCLGRKTQQLNVVRERYEGSLLTSGLMSVVCARQGEGRDKKSHFMNLCSRALGVLQNPSTSAALQQLLILMKPSGADDLYRMEHVGYCQNYLRPHWPSHQADAWVRNQIEKNLGSAVNFWRNVEQNVRHALGGAKKNAANRASAKAKPEYIKLAKSFGFAPALPFGGSFRCGPMIPSECGVFASKAKPLKLTFDGLVSTRFKSHTLSRNVCGKNHNNNNIRSNTQSVAVSDDMDSEISREIGSTSSWKGFVYKSGSGNDLFSFMWTSMKNRWVVIQNGELSWYSKQDEKNLKGKFSLRNYTVGQLKEDSR